MKITPREGVVTARVTSGRYWVRTSDPLLVSRHDGKPENGTKVRGVGENKPLSLLLTVQRVQGHGTKVRIPQPWYKNVPFGRYNGTKFCRLSVRQISRSFRNRNSEKTSSVYPLIWGQTGRGRARA